MASPQPPAGASDAAGQPLLSAPAATAHTPDRAFEVFVKRTISSIQKEAWGRGKDARDLRDACQNVLNLLTEHEQGLVYGGSLAVAVLEPLYLACASSNPKVVELALGCLHKLVAHAWLQGESSSGGQASDADVVSRVIRTVIACGETGGGEAQQLAVVRALLTFTTAEHFIAHGDCLLAAVRMVFNLALGAEDEIIKRTASNALLQMLNTIAKRVTAFELFASSSACSSRTSMDGSSGHSFGGPGPSQPPQALGGAAPHHHHGRHHSHHSSLGLGGSAPDGAALRECDRIPSLEELQRSAELAAASGARSAAGGGGTAGTIQQDSSVRSGRSAGSQGQPPDASGLASQQLTAGVARDGGGGGGDADVSGASGAEEDAAAEGRAEQFAHLAEQRDLRGLEEAIGRSASIDLDAAVDSEDEGMSEIQDTVSMRSGATGGGIMVVTERGPSIMLLTSTASGLHGPTGLPPRPSRLPHADGSAGGVHDGIDGAGGAHGRHSRRASDVAGDMPLRVSIGGTTPQRASASGMAPPVSNGNAAAAGRPSSDGISASATGPSSSAAPFTPSSATGLAGDHAPPATGGQPEPPSTPTAPTPSAHHPAHPPHHHRGGHSHHHHHHHHQHSQQSLGGPPPPPPQQRPVLRTTERDVLLVLTAFCKLASREAGVTDIDSYLQQGKLLSLELVVKVLQNPQHCWDNVRSEFVAHLHQPLSLVLLRNCSPTDLPAFTLATKLLLCVMVHPKLRRGLKAELGAFYPLMLLRPLEAEVLAPGPDLSAVATVLPVLRQLCGEPQLLMDLFVNYDCEMRAPNLYERTAQALSKLAQRTALDGPAAANAKATADAARQLAGIRDAAVACLLAIISSLDAWASPLKDALAQQQQQAGLGLPPAAPQAGLPGGGSFSSSSAAAGGGGGGGGGGALAGEPERVEAAKVTKSSLEQGLAMFNRGSPVKAMRFLINSGLVEASPAGAAVFIRAHASDLDLSAVGEFFGHHEDFEVAAMHAFIDMERYASVSIDVALRRLLLQFRLPGEAQKIDRIMEKFAERYCRDNPTAFRNADAAYVLAFAIIMLNTDAHNPLAERRLAKSDFVAMNSAPAAPAPVADAAADGRAAEGDAGAAQAPPPTPLGSVVAMEPVMPIEELEGIYERIVAQEIVVRDGLGDGRSGAAGGAANGRNAGRGNKLAAAMGLRALAAPLRFTLGSWDKKQATEAERRRHQSLVESAARAMTRGAGLWQSSVHAEHARPMLMVTGSALQAALNFCLAPPSTPSGDANVADAAGGAAAAQAAAASASSELQQFEVFLKGMVLLAELAGLLGLEALCEQAIAALAVQAGVSRPAQYGCLAARKQLAALRALLGAAAGPAAGQLGSAWAVILRAASGLEALVRSLTLPLQPGEAGAVALVPAPGDAAAAAANGNGRNASAGGSSSSGYSSIGRMFQALGFLSGGGSSNNNSGGGAAGQHATTGGAASTRQAGNGPHALPPPPVRALAGGAMVMWAVTDGRPIIEQVYQRSSSLDGEAVVVFFRALCAVSREELDAQQPRTYSLQRLVEVAQLNMSCRIRLIASKIWAVTGAHLVMTACHHHQAVATQAVEAMRLLSAKLLGRPELAHYTAQEAALRPFSAVLRQADDAGVRQLAVQCVTQAMHAHSRSLGSGWRMVLEVMARGAADTSPQVYSQAIIGLRSVIGCLFISSSASAAPSHGRTTTPAGPSVALAAAGSSSGTTSGSSSGGHEYFGETLRAVLAALQNPHHVEEATGAVQLLNLLAGRLAQRPTRVPSGPMSGRPGASAGSGRSGRLGGGRRSSDGGEDGDGDEHNREHLLGSSGGSVSLPQAVRTSSSGGAGGSGQPSTDAAAPPGSRQFSPTPQDAASASAAAVLSPQRNGSGPLVARHNSLWVELGPLSERAAVAAAASDDWALLLEVAADVAYSGAERPRVANASLEAAFDIMVTHGSLWSRRTWRVMLSAVLQRVAFRVPPALDARANPEAAAQALASGLPLESIAGGFVARVERWYPLLTSQIRSVREVQGPVMASELLTLLAATALAWFQHPVEAVARVGLSAVSRLMAALGSLPGAAAGGSGVSSRGDAGSEAASGTAQAGWDVLLPLLERVVADELYEVLLYSANLAVQQERQAASAAPVAPSPGAGRVSGGGAGPVPIPGSAAAPMMSRTSVSGSGVATGAGGGVTAGSTRSSMGGSGTVRAVAAALMPSEDATKRLRCRMLLLLMRALALCLLQAAPPLEQQRGSEQPAAAPPRGVHFSALPLFTSSQQQPAAQQQGHHHHTQHRMQLPWPVARSLLALLVRCGQKVMRFNVRQELQEAAGQIAVRTSGSGGAAADAAPSLGPSTSAPMVSPFADLSVTVSGASTVTAAATATAVTAKEAAAGLSRLNKAAGGSGAAGEGWEEEDGWSEVDGEEAAEAAAKGGERASASGEPPEAGAGAPQAGGAGQAQQQQPGAVAAATAAAAEAAAAAPSAPSGPQAVTHGLRLSLPAAQLQLSSTTSHDSLRPALSRLEVEPLDAAISVLHLHADAAGAGRPAASAAAGGAGPEARSLLLELCRSVLDVHVNAHPPHAPARHAAAGSADEPAALDPSMPGSSWDHAVRAPVLARCVQLLCRHLPSEAERLELMPQVLALLGSHQAVVRQAVAAYLEEVAGPLIMKQPALPLATAAKQ